MHCRPFVGSPATSAGSRDAKHLRLGTGAAPKAMLARVEQVAPRADGRKPVPVHG
jgi:hypothetical protein